MKSPDNHEFQIAEVLSKWIKEDDPKRKRELLAKINSLRAILEKEKKASSDT